MTAITTGGNGAWNSTVNNAPWVGGVVPAAGDTVIIANGHTVTIPNGYTAQCGVDAVPHTVPAIQTRLAGSGTGVLQIQDGGNLTVFGDVLTGGAPWTMGAGCTLTAACTTATIPFLISDGSSLASFTVNGTSVARSIITKAGGAVGWKVFGNDVTNWGGGGQWTCTYTTISSVGGAAQQMHVARPTTVGWSAGFTNCLISGCGRIEFTHSMADTTNYSWTNTTYSAPADTGEVVAILLFAAWTTGTRSFAGCCWEGKIQMVSASAGIASGWDVSDIFCRNYTQANAKIPFDWGTSTTCIIKSWTNVVILNTLNATLASTVPGGGTLSRTLTITSCSGLNNHAIEQTMCAAVTWDTLIHFSALADETGDGIQVFGAAAGPFAVTVQNCIALPSGADATVGSGSFFNLSLPTNAANVLPIFKNNTVFLGKNNLGGGGIMSENVSWAAGQVTGAKDSIFWRGSPGATGQAQWRNLSVPADGAFVGFNYNWAFNVGAAGTYYTDAAAKFSAPSPPGANDTVGTDPQFVDSTRNPLTWIGSLGFAATLAALSAELFKRNNVSGWDARVTPAAVMDFIRGGFVPTNVATSTSSSTGGQVGAMAYASASTYEPLTDRRRRGTGGSW